MPFAGDAPLSVEQAVSMLDAGPADAPAASPEAAPSASPPSEAVGATDSELPANPEAEDVGEPGEASPDATAEPAEPAQPVVEPPHFWDAAHKEKFAQLPPELQAVLVEQTKAGERAVNAKFEEAAAARKAAEADKSEVSRLKAEIDQVLPTARAAFQSRWANVTPEQWVAYAQQDPDGYTAARAQMEAEQATMQRLEAAQQKATAEAHKSFVSEQVAEMARIIPELAKPDTAKPTMDKMVAYARTQGATDEQLNWASAREWQLINKARLWDESQAKLTNPAPRPVAAAPVRPAASQASVPPQQRVVAAARSQLAKRPSVDAAVALLDALG